MRVASAARTLANEAARRWPRGLNSKSMARSIGAGQRWTSDPPGADPKAACDQEALSTNIAFGLLFAGGSYVRTSSLEDA